MNVFKQSWMMVLSGFVLGSLGGNYAQSYETEPLRDRVGGSIRFARQNYPILFRSVTFSRLNDHTLAATLLPDPERLAEAAQALREAEIVPAGHESPFYITAPDSDTRIFHQLVTLVAFTSGLDPGPMRRSLENLRQSPPTGRDAFRRQVAEVASLASVSTQVLERTTEGRPRNIVLFFDGDVAPFNPFLHGGFLEMANRASNGREEDALQRPTEPANSPLPDLEFIPEDVAFDSSPPTAEEIAQNRAEVQCQAQALRSTIGQALRLIGITASIECPICQQAHGHGSQVVRPRCACTQHAAYCRGCLSTWLESSYGRQRCPRCRARVRSLTTTAVPSLEDTERFVRFLNEQSQDANHNPNTAQEEKNDDPSDR